MSTTYGDLGLDSLQSLLIRSELLITDFSSIVFDAVLVKTRVVYYQFDKDVFRDKGHLKKGWFDYEKDGLGPVFYVWSELANFLICYNSNDRSGEYEIRMQKLRDEIYSLRNSSESLIQLALHEDNDIKELY